MRKSNDTLQSDDIALWKNTNMSKIYMYAALSKILICFILTPTGAQEMPVLVC